MENFVVSARKYRPDRFEIVVGQPSITKTLKNSISSGKLAHAYLFCGPRGVGKTTCARIFAKTINCSNIQSDTEACGECDSCKTFQENRSFSIHELDAASNNTVDDIRTLIEQVRIPPQVGKYSIYIIDEVHMLSQQAFNSFLKTLEEPPKHAIFILATTEKHKIIPTILSRCQIFDFNRIGIPEITNHLKKVASEEKVDFEEAALNIIAYKADGSMRDALSIFDQVVSFSGKKIDYQTVVDNLNVLDHDYYFKLTDAFLDGRYKDSLMIFDEILGKGFDSHNFINGLGGHFRNLMVSRDPETIELMELGGDIAAKYEQTARLCSLPFLFNSLKIINQADIHFKQAKDSRLHVEICLLKLCSQTPSPLNETTTVEAVATKADSQNTQTPRPDVSGQSTSSQASPNQTVKELVTEAAKPTAKPNGVKTTPRLSDFLKKDPPEAPPVAETPSESKKPVLLECTPDNIVKLWKEFAEQIRADQPRLYNTLISQDPALSEHEVIVKLGNPLQAKAMDDIHYDLESYLKSRTGNQELSIVKEVEKTVQSERKLFTQEEKYRHLMEKNPAIGQFRQNLKLDFE